MSIQGKAINRTSGALLTAGNVSVSIFDASTAGNLIFNDTFNNTISNGTFNVLLGSQFQLNLTYNKMYFMELAINREIVIGNTNRRQFFATGGPNQTYLSVSEDSSGNVGIGTLSPAARLEVTGSANTLALNVNNTLYVNTTTSMVGIGTAAPGKLLDVAGTIGATGTVTLTGSGQRLVLTGGGTNAIYQTVSNTGGTSYFGMENNAGGNIAGGSLAYATILEAANDATYGNIQFATGANGDVAMTILGTGNVGISTIAPLATLNVVGTVVLNGTANTLALNVNNSLYVNTTTSNVGIGTASPNATLNVRGGANITGSVNLATLEGNVGINNVGPNATLHISGAANTLALNVNNTLYVNTTTSNVGIGRKNPSGLLDIIRTPVAPSIAVVINQQDATNWAIDLTDAAYGMVIRNGGTTALQTTGSGNILFAGNVGIGTAIPQQKLDVNGTLIVNSSGNVGLWSNGTNVGIGTTGPAEKLTVSGSLFLNDGNGYSKIYGTDTTHMIVFRGIYNSAIDATSYYERGGNLLEGKGHRFFTGGTTDVSAQIERMRISNDGIYISGNIGINTTAPNEKLHIVGNIFVNATGDTSATRSFNSSDIILQASGYNGTATFWPNVTIRNAIAGSNMTNRLAVIINGSERVSVDSQGRVGIGTAAPLQKLDLSGDFAFVANTGGTENRQIFMNPSNTGGTNTTNGGGTLIIGLGNSGVDESNPPWNGSIIVGASDVVFRGFSAGGAYQGSIEFFTKYNGNAASRMLITNDGNVGIGTTAPEAKLHVEGEARVTGQLVFTYGEGSPNWVGAKIDMIDNADFGYLAFITRNGAADINERMRIDNLGNVGIGTTNPQQKLDVNGTLIVNSSGNVGLWSNGTNVGIGTTAPENKLHIAVDDASNNTVTNVLRLDHTTSGTPAAGIGTGIQFIIERGGGAGANAGIIQSRFTDVTNGVEDSDIDIIPVLDSSLATSYLTIASTGKVGIGTTSPNATLQIMGAANTLALNVNNTLYVNTTTSYVGIGTTEPVEKLHLSGGSLRLINQITNYTALKMRGGSLTSDRILISFISDGEGIYSQIVGTVTNITGGGLANAGDLTFRTASGSVLSDQMTILSSGKVGIGTASPSAKLEVNGSANTLALNVNNTLYVNTTTSMVGIGTATPSANLQVLGYARFGSATSAVTNQRAITIRDTGDMASIELEANGTNGRNWTIFSLDSTSTETIGGAGKLAIRDVTASTTRMIIDASGNVGINTTAPSATLNVIGTVVLNGTANTLALNVNNTLYVNTSSSRVGIGIASPNAKLAVGSATTANLTEWYNSTSPTSNDKLLAVNSTGGMCFGPTCSGQIFFNGTAMVIRVA